MNNQQIYQLSQIISKDIYMEHIENIISDYDVLIDAGFYVEIYWNEKGISYVNPEDIEKGNVDTGVHEWLYIDKPCTYAELLALFPKGSIVDETLTISTIPNMDSFFSSYRGKANPISLYYQHRIA